MRLLAALFCAHSVAALGQDLSYEAAPQAYRAGHFEQAVTALDKQLAAAKGAERVAALYWRGQAQGALGARNRAIDDLTTAWKEGGESAQVMGALGMQYALAGATQRARPLLERALELSRGNPQLEAAARADMAELLRREGKPADARLEALRALELARDPGLVARLATGLGMASRAAEAARAMPASHDKAYRLIAAAQIAPATSDARSLLESANGVARNVGDLRAVSHAEGQLGKLDEDAGRVEPALEHTRRAVFAAQQANATEALYRWQWQGARLLEKSGRREGAEAGYARALASFAAIRQDLIVELRANGQSYRETVGPLYLEYADLLLKKARASADAGDKQKLLVEARDAVESLKAVELEDYFQDECVAALQARQKGIDEVEPRTAILYPVILPTRVEMLVSLAGGIRQVEIPVSGAELAAEALAMRRFLEKRSTHQYLPHARKLYDWLVRPIEPLLAAAQVDTLVIVPDGPLRAIPLAALNDGAQFLVERYALATAPGLKLIEPRSLQVKSTRMLLNGLTLSVQNFPALPYVASELQAIGEIVPGKELKDRAFVVKSFEQELRSAPYSIVHIASHGQFDSDPKKSFLLAYDGRLDMDELERVMKLSRFRDEPIELLTLSACRTAAGDERAALGLAGVAVKAGARSALATLWYINDQASSAMVAEFYRRLAEPGTSKARALQQAQKELMQDPRYRHPGFWSPFLLIGNWL